MRERLFRPPITLVIVLSAHNLIAQQKPNLSGKWTSLEARGQTLTISQDATSVTITKTDLRLEHAFVYRLDGSESHNQTLSLSGETWTYVSHANWITNALVVNHSTTRASTGRPWDWMEIYFLESGTGNLKVTTLDAILNPGPFMGLRTVTYTKN